MKKNIRIQFSILFFSIFMLCVISCSKEDVLDQETLIAENLEEEEELVKNYVIPDFSNTDPSKIISVNTGSTEGLFYNFWSTRPMINQTRFNASGFRTSVQNLKSYVKSYNLVRMMGGRTDNNNTFYKGVDASGKISPILVT